MSETKREELLDQARAAREKVSATLRRLVESDLADKRTAEENRQAKWAAWAARAVECAGDSLQVYLTAEGAPALHALANGKYQAAEDEIAEHVCFQFDLIGFRPFDVSFCYRGGWPVTDDGTDRAQNPENWLVSNPRRGGSVWCWTTTDETGQGREFSNLVDTLHCAYKEPPQPEALTLDAPAATVLPCECELIDLDAGNNVQLYPFSYQGALDVQRRPEGLRFAVLTGEGKEIAHVTLEWGGPVDSLLNVVNEWADEAEAPGDDDQGDDDQGEPHSDGRQREGGA